MRFPGFVGPTYQNITIETDAQETVNLYPEKDESGAGRNDMILLAGPGKALFGTAANGSPHRGMFAQDGRAFTVAGTKLYEMNAGGALTERGTVAADGRPAAMASNGTIGSQLFVVSGGSGYILNLTTNILTGIGGGFPVGAVGACYRDGYFFTVAGGFVYASNLADGSTWSASSKAQRNIGSDNLVGVVVDDHRVIWLVGSQTSEPWYDAATSPFPLQPIPGAYMGMGSVGVFAQTRFDNSIAMVSQSDAGGRVAIIAGSGYTAQRISTHPIEVAWGRYGTVSDAYAWTYQENGHTFAVFTFPTQNETWVYDAATQLWHKRGVWNPLTAHFDADLGAVHCYAFGMHLVGSRVDGSVYRQSMDLYDDNGTPKRWLRRTPYAAKEADWVFFDEFRLLMETGVGTVAAGEGQDPHVMMRTSDDGGRTWGPERQAGSGKLGQYRQEAFWARCGRSKMRCFEVSGTAPVKTSLIDAFVTVS